MRLNPCFFCGIYTSTPVHLTEIHKDGTYEEADLCESCGKEYMSEKPKVPKIDLTHITTTEQLLDFISSIELPNNPPAPCVCGWTDADFDKYGKMSCNKCYDHFKEKLERIVYPYHNASEHIGKRPKRLMYEKMMANPVEKRKFLKLKYAKALELEEYEKLAELQSEIDSVTRELDSDQSPP